MLIGKKESENSALPESTFPIGGGGPESTTGAGGGGGADPIESSMKEYVAYLMKQL